MSENRVGRDRETGREQVGEEQGGGKPRPYNTRNVHFACS